MAYYRVSAFKDILLSVNKVIEDLQNDCGCGVRSEWGKGRYKPQKGHFDLDTFGVPGAALRGLFEYWYTSNSLILYPHLPEDIKLYEQIMALQVCFHWQYTTYSLLYPDPNL